MCAKNIIVKTNEKLKETTTEECWKLQPLMSPLRPIPPSPYSSPIFPYFREQKDSLFTVPSLLFVLIFKDEDSFLCPGNCPLIVSNRWAFLFHGRRKKFFVLIQVTINGVAE
ncbi:hypothetical protein CEXT_189961 [Caerostris extrusa]|uniref:Uncharacterized protein n=1 Tax=Caerostris extrusa TaxID=172846 RepID=A0AAV4R951_CAEEX|nr:hypothetical protein CEXT_189961 [Caerostris extrusa]